MLGHATAPDARRRASAPATALAAAGALARVIPRGAALGALAAQALCAALLATLAPSPAAAQYFGRNKVNYETFDFRVIRTPTFDVHFYPAESTATADM
ncbi:MAG TPA: hypothetical protein VFS40_01205, partial [Gemmatimonadales bacterium]|nr:hypothetical protein [Gemmatimonadales bacterium]